MALILSSNSYIYNNNNNYSFRQHKPLQFSNPYFKISFNLKRRPFCPIVGQLNEGKDPSDVQDNDEVNNLGVKAALSMLKFYKREISPLMPNSCRYLPTCSEYSMISYKKYGVVKGTILTAWRLCRCNPLGDSGFDPPRWFGETSPPEE